MLLKALLLFFVGSLNILIGLVVISRDYKRLQNQLFLALTVSLGGWVIGIGGFLLAHNPVIALNWAKVYYLFPLIIAASMPLFARSFPINDRIPKKWWYPILLGYLLTTIPLLFSRHFLTQSISYHDWGKEVALNRIDYLIYSVYLVGCFVVGLIHSFIKMRRSSGFVALQTRFFFVGFLVTSFFGVLFNLFYPWFGNYKMIWLGPLFTNALVITIGYSIIRHRLFDVRFIITRSLAYILSVGALGLLYGLTTFGLLNGLLLKGVHLSVEQQAILTLLAVAIAFTYRPLKLFFDRISSRYFYQDSYNSQLLLDDLNKLFVSTFDLEKLLRQCAAVIERHIKVEFCFFAVRRSDSQQFILEGSTGKNISASDYREVFSSKVLKNNRVVIADHIEDVGDEFLIEMQNNGWAAIATLVDAAKGGRVSSIGYLVMGPKKSGYPYNKADAQVLEIIANELIIALQNTLRFEQIEEFNLTLQQKVDEATRRLRQTNEKLKKLDETKDDFISMASHQLRTPLTSVKGYVSMVLDGDAGKINKQQHDLLNQAFISSERMVYLIADLLNVSRLRTGKFIIEAAATNLVEVIDGEIAQLTESAKSRNLTLSFDRPKQFPQLMLDETKIRQVIMNFSDNAIYYTPSGGQITIKLEDKTDSIEFTVTDNGIGVPKHEQHHLFGKFYRAGNARKARPDGTGLGLFMAKKVIVASGGALIFKSEEGKGSTFGFSFPKHKLLVK